MRALKLLGKSHAKKFQLFFMRCDQSKRLTHKTAEKTAQSLPKLTDTNNTTSNKGMTMFAWSRLSAKKVKLRALITLKIAVKK